MSAQIKKIKVQELPIRLGQLLKFADLVQDGFEAKIRIQNGEVMVNGSVEIRRGKQLKKFDTVTMNKETWVIDLDF